MDHRIGECSSCGAVYKLPADFAHDQARCKKCGGVVEIGAAQASDAAPKRQAPAASVPAPKPAPAKPAPPIPAKKIAPAPPASPAAPRRERSGPSMKEQILARKESAEPTIPRAPQGASARIVAPPSVQQPHAIGMAGRGASAAKPHSTVPAKAARPGAAPARAGTPASAPAAARRTAPARSRRGGDEDAEGGEGGGRGARRGAHGGKKKNASLMPGIIALVVLVVLGGAAWYVTDRMKTEAAAKEESARAAQPLDAGAGAANPSAAGDGGSAAGAPVTDGAPDAGAASGSEATGAGADESAPDAAAPAAQDADAKPAEAPKPEKRAAGDPNSVDLSAIPDFEPVAGVSDERWTELRQLAAAVVDPLSGAAGNRAKLQLEQAGKEAFPALLNVFKRLDLTTDDGFRSADVVQKTLEKICNGNNFGWLYQHQENWLYYDKKAIQSWCTKWDQVKDDEAAWLKLTKQDKPGNDEPGAAKKDEPIIGDDFDIDDG